MVAPIPPISRRALCAGLFGSTLGAAALAQTAPPSAPNPPPRPETNVAPVRFNFDEVVGRAKQMAAAPYRAPAPGPTLAYDAYREVRFRADRAFLNEPGSRFRLQLFATGAPNSTPIVVNIVRDGVAHALAYAPDLFDFGPRVSAQERASIKGFAGLRLLYPLDVWTRFDEAIAFLGANCFRLGRGQVYGSTMRGLTIGSDDPGQPQEAPAFREFWIEQPAADADSVGLVALLDGPSVAGAYRMTVTPGQNTVVEVEARIFARAPVAALGVASISSMYFTGESGPRILDDYRREVHDLSGLLTQTQTDEWIWRPLRNPAAPARTQIADRIKGFGLLQRLRAHYDYEDLEANFERRPSYWVEPIAGFEDGAVELLELSATGGASDNIVANWRPATALPAGQSRTWTYRISTREDDPDRHVVARARHTLIARSAANVAGAAPGAQRFLIDFDGPELGPYHAHPEDLAIIASAASGKVTATRIAAHPESPRLRVTVDVVPDAGRRADVKVALAARGRQISETWTFLAQG